MQVDEREHKTATRSGEFLKDVGRYRKLVEKLNYLKVNRSDITFICSVVSQFRQYRSYPLGDGNKDFEIPEESFRESFFVQIMDTP